MKMMKNVRCFFVALAIIAFMSSPFISTQAEARDGYGQSYEVAQAPPPKDGHKDEHKPPHKDGHRPPHKDGHKPPHKDGHKPPHKDGQKPPPHK